jgi:transposase
MDWFEIVKGAEEDAEKFYDKTMRSVFTFADDSLEEIKNTLERLAEHEKQAESAFSKIKGTFMEDVLEPMRNYTMSRNKIIKETLQSHLEEILALRDIFQKLDSRISAVPIRQRLMVMRNNLTEELGDLVDVEEFDKVIADLAFEGRDDLR